MSKLLLRQSLLTKLQLALDNGHVIVEAPAGYGKTVLLRQLVSSRPQSYLIQLTIADSDLNVLQARLAAWLESKTHNATRTLLLDDAHHLQANPATTQFFTDLINRPHPRLLLCARYFPPNLALPPAVQHFQASDLAFALAESRALLEKMPANACVQWHQKLEGWPLAIGLLSQMRNRQEIVDLARPRLFQYLAQHVVDELPRDLKDFLRATAPLLRFNDDLAARLCAQDNVAQLRRRLQRRNLFIFDDERPGWYRYHELIREFILETDTDARQPLLRHAVDWFTQQGDLDMAIEHAFIAGLPALAAEKLHDACDTILLRQGRLWSYRRWLEQLPPAILRRHLPLLSPFIRKLHEAGLREEAWRYMGQFQSFTVQAGDTTKLAEYYWLRAFLFFNESRHEDSLTALASAPIPMPDTDHDLERRQAELLAHNLAGLNRLQEARHAYRRAIALAQSTGNIPAANYSRHNLVNLVLIRQGRLQEAQETLLAGDAFFEESGAYLLAGHLLSWCELYQESGDWDRLAQVLQRQDDLIAQLDEWIDDDRLYVLWSRAILSTAQGDFRRAQETLDEALSLPVEDDLAQLCLATAQVWLYRRKDEPRAAILYAEQALRKFHKWPYWRAILALERELASPTVEAPLAPEISQLIAVRATPQLLRVRALLTIRCWTQQDKRWRRHFDAVLRGLQQPHMEALLTARDPELGLEFWRIALLEHLAQPQAEEALIAIGNAPPLLDLLAHDQTTIRVRVAPILAAIGDERAMPALEQAARAEQDGRARRPITRSLHHLESLPPPPLHIELMGAFRMSRGGEPVSSAAFHRPIVLRLLQYFSIHRRRILPRDRILEDLWPDTPYERAWSTFRSVHSRLRKVLEPHMRINGPVRFFNVEGESYQFDPLDRVTVDSEQFENIVRITLREAATTPIAPLPRELLTSLHTWQPLLPDLAYADWIAETRQRLHDVYVNGCLYVAQAFLQRDEPAAAIEWVKRTLETAPWVETAYQILMRAYAHQGHRALALKVYGDAVEALAAEFAVAPSPLTEWLRSRLEAGESI